MNRLICVTALALLAAGCSKEDVPAAASEDTAIGEEQAAETVTEPVENLAAETESLEVVEESAAEAEPENQAIVLARADIEAPRNWQFKEGATTPA